MKRTLAIVAALSALTATALALQPVANPPAPPTAPPGAQPAQLPPALILGKRAEIVRTRLAVLPVVVVVPDGPSYAAAVSGWSLERRYPVLIDDGSWRARNDIARFVRAFAPKDVIRWQRPKNPDGSAPPAWPSDPTARRQIISSAAAAAFGATSAADLKTRFALLKLEPIGVVVANDADPAWTGALALAAGRGQPIVFVNHGSGSAAGIPDAISQENALALLDDVERGVGALGYPWETAGDQIDAVTICLNVPGKVALPEGDKRGMLALTDVIGRGPRGQFNRLWAWSGQIFGNEAQAAYRAMSCLYLQQRRAWLFDGYESGPPWNQYDMTTAGTDLIQGGFSVEVADAPKQGLEDWRLGTARVSNAPKDAPIVYGVDAGLIAVNTMGFPETFELRPGQAKAADIPVLARPAIAIFVHSFSAAHVYNPGTIAGRFFQNGAYAYVGSVHEPGLAAFVPTPLVMKRLLVGFPLGAAVRRDASPAGAWPDPWKVGVFGDPLICFGPPAPVAAGDVPLAGTVSLTAQVAEDVKAKRFEPAMLSLWLLGRDRDASRLASALATQGGDAWTAPVARNAVASTFFTGESSTFAKAYVLATGANPDPNAMPGAMDMVWNAFYPTLRTSRPEEAAAMRNAIRWDINMRDAVEAFVATKAAEGDAAARAFADKFRATLSSDDARTAFEAQLIKP